MTRKRALIYAATLALEGFALIGVWPTHSATPPPKNDPTSEVNLDHALMLQLEHANDSMIRFCNGYASLEMLPNGGSDIIGTCPDGRRLGTDAALGA